MHPDLDRCLRRIASATAGLSRDVAERPGPGGAWSVANTLDHLDLAFRLNAEGLARRLAKGKRSTARRRSWRQWLAQTVVIGFGYFPRGRTAPAGVLPTGRPFRDALAAIDEHLPLLDARLAEAARQFGERAAVLDHPVMGPLSVRQWRRFHWVHTRHHLRILARRAAG
jgi:glutathione S-transferase